MRYRRYFIFFLTLVLFNSCETDVDLHADWKETTIVYGILNTQDTVHYIKINKAFLGDGEVLKMAQVYDSLYHKDSLIVKLSELNNGNLIQEIQLITDTTIPKNPGTFAYPNQLLYRTPGLITLNSSYNYKLSIAKANTASVMCSTETNLVKDFTVYKPSSATGSIIAWAGKNAYLTTGVEWESAENGILYELLIRFHYLELDKITGDTVSIDSLDWLVFTGIKSSTASGGEDMSYEIAGERFYNYVNTRLEENSNIKRIAGTLDFIFYVGGQELNTYIDINNAQSGLTQTQIKPEYTNIKGGLGVLSSRYYKKISGKTMGQYTVDSLACGTITGHLGFLKYDGSDICN